MDSLLSQKFKIKSGQRVIILNPPEGYLEYMGSLPEGVQREINLSGTFDFIQLFIKNSAELKKNIPTLKNYLKENGTLWITYPKKSSKMETDLSRDNTWEFINKYSLRGISLISIDGTWSAFGARKGEKPQKKSAVDAELLSKHIDLKNRIVTPPIDLQKELIKNASAGEFFESLSFTNKKEYVVWLITAKREKTREERIIKTISKLKNGLKNPSEKKIDH